MVAHSGDAVLDALLYRDHVRTDARMYVKLYGLLSEYDGKQIFARSGQNLPERHVPSHLYHRQGSHPKVTRSNGDESPGKPKDSQLYRDDLGRGFLPIVSCLMTINLGTSNMGGQVNPVLAADKTRLWLLNRYATAKAKSDVEDTVPEVLRPPTELGLGRTLSKRSTISCHHRLLAVF